MLLLAFTVPHPFVIFVRSMELRGMITEVASGEIKYLDTKAVTIDIDNLSDYKYLILDFPEGAQNGNDHVDIANALRLSMSMVTALVSRYFISPDATSVDSPFCLRKTTE